MSLDIVEPSARNKFDHSTPCPRTDNLLGSYTAEALGAFTLIILLQC